MTTPNDDLTRLICAEIQKQGLATQSEVEKIAKKILNGKVKAEDWYALFENSLPKDSSGVTNGN